MGVNKRQVKNKKEKENSNIKQAIILKTLLTGERFLSYSWSSHKSKIAMNIRVNNSFSTTSSYNLNTYN